MCRAVGMMGLEGDGDDDEETVEVGEGGVVEVRLEKAQGVLLQASDDAAACAGDGEGSDDELEQVGDSAAVSAASVPVWLGLAAAFWAGFALI